jgi:hypothetical protein
LPNAYPLVIIGRESGGTGAKTAFFAYKVNRAHPLMLEVLE